MITWDIYSGDLTVQTGTEQAARSQNYGPIGSVLEAMYAEEINTFIDVVQGQRTWPQTYAASQHSSATLAAAEESSVADRWVRVEPKQEPELSPPHHS
jgi:hypothetical protein